MRTSCSSLTGPLHGGRHTPRVSLLDHNPTTVVASPPPASGHHFRVLYSSNKLCEEFCSTNPWPNSLLPLPSLALAPPWPVSVSPLLLPPALAPPPCRYLRFPAAWHCGFSCVIVCGMGGFYFTANWVWWVEGGLVVLYVPLPHCIVDILACLCVEWVEVFY